MGAPQGVGGTRVLVAHCRAAGVLRVLAVQVLGLEAPGRCAVVVVVVVVVDDRPSEWSL